MKKILVIDDDPQFTDLISLQLEKEGFAVDCLHLVDHLDSYIQKTAYDLIILDVFLPDKQTGLNTLVNLKRNIFTKHTPIILATSQPTELFIQEENVDEYLRYAKALISKLDEHSKIISQVKEILG
ncbi:response regulator transcription factor [Candidatus Beckwithbacteria bacterium]|nr:response regulator transcription factor [Candidatus Beckwithbacteria bacterium]